MLRKKRTTTDYLVYFSHMSQQVGIFETTHFEGSYPVIRLFDFQDNRLTIFTNDYCYRQFRFLFGKDIDRYQWVIQGENESLRKFIGRAAEQVRAQQMDIFYVNTVDNNHLFFAQALSALGKTRTVLTLHDINTHFRFRFKFQLRRLVRILGKKRLIKVAGEFNVVAQPMQPYLKDILHNSKPVHCVPGAYFDPNLYIHPALPVKNLRLVVPGSIDGKRRNYETVLELAKECSRLNLSVQFTLLGGAQDSYGQDILMRCKDFDNIKIYAEEVVDQPEFDRVMNEAHLVFVPSVIDTVISDDIPEVYGLTKSSGNMFDIIKHARPFMAPQALQVDSVLESSCLRYVNTEEMIARLKELLISENYQRLAEQAYLNSMSYTMDAIRERNPSLFKS